MSRTTPKYAYFLAIIFGLLVFFIPQIEPIPLTLGLIFLLGGSLFGFLWPKESWRWGLWLTGPMIVFLGLSVVFAGELEMFVKKDLPILLAALSAACLGSFIAARIKRKQRASS